jgi:hypothetical protein
MTRLVTTARAAQSAGRPLQPPGCCASRTRPPPAALDPGATADPAAGSPRGRPPPAPTHAPPELTPNPDDRGPQPPTFLAHCQASAGTRQLSRFAERYGVSRETVHAWLRRYRREGPGLADGRTACITTRGSWPPRSKHECDPSTHDRTPEETNAHR